MVKLIIIFNNGDPFASGEMFLFENDCVGIVKYMGEERRPNQTIYPVRIISRIDVLDEKFLVQKYYIPKKV